MLPLKEHDIVITNTKTREYPKGLRGTIVHIYGGVAKVCEVEFVDDDNNTVVTTTLLKHLTRVEEHKTESADKRPVSTDALATLGKIIDDTAARDAIHLAVEPAIAGEILEPGCHIGIKNGKAYRNMDSSKPGHCDKHTGIVDPFLIRQVNEGQRFWLIVYPRQITSLRHVWVHPDFPDPEIKPKSGSVEESKKWMMTWAKEWMQDEEDDDATAYNNAISAGHETHVGHHESAADHIDGEWWDHWENITGLKGER